MQIRQQAFETNSSSVHAFTKVNTNLIDRYNPELGEYGWDKDILNGESFVDYIFTLFFVTEEFDTCSEILKIVNSEFDIEHYNKNHSADAYYDGFYVDHSYDKLQAMKEAIERYGLKEVVLGFQCETGNDNEYEESMIPTGDFVGGN